MKSLALPLTLLAFAAAPVLAQQGKLASADASAMKKLAEANFAEIDGGKVAASKAQNADVKSFAQKMVDDHTKMLDDLKKLADAKGVKLPQSASAKDKAEAKAMEALSGERFDRRYMEHMVKDHQKDARETDQIAAKAQDPDFKKAVQDANGKIKEHLQLAEQVAGALKGSSRGSSASSK